MRGRRRKFNVGGVVVLNSPPAWQKAATSGPSKVHMISGLVSIDSLCPGPHAPWVPSLFAQKVYSVFIARLTNEELGILGGSTV